MNPTVIADRALRRHPGSALAGLCVLVLAILAVSVALIGTPGHPTRTGKLSPHPPPATGRLIVPLPPPDLYRPLTPEQAMVENAQRVATTRPDTPAAAFNAKSADEDSHVRALECLAQAIYYEAASEPVEGQRAVAQIVLNRVRHPAYPATVCGVVYQGSERTTGCQFSFTCDGSLRRTPASGLWQRARKLAADALAGKVFAPVGHATYYHADYVVPYWADSLDKEIQIGRHIFYRLRGGLGTTRAFVQRYRGQEPSPLSPTDIAVVENAFDSSKPATEGADPFASLGGPAAVTPKPANPILADQDHGELLADAGRTGLLLPLAKRVPPPTASLSSCPISGPVVARTVAVNNRLGAESVGKCPS